MNVVRTGDCRQLPIFRNLISRCRQPALIIWLMLVCIGATADETADETEHYLEYRVSVGWLDAGQISLVIRRNAFQYELFGEVETNPALRLLIAWSGRVAAVGEMVADQPNGHAYFLAKNKKGARSYLLAARKSTTKISKKGTQTVVPQPAGTDVMSALFAARDCFQADTVHDGEDSYPVQVFKPQEAELAEASGFYSGAAKRCHYIVRTERSNRQITVWLAAVNGQVVPVKLRYHLPFRPDGIVLLKLPESGATGANRKQAN